MKVQKSARSIMTAVLLCAAVSLTMLPYITYAQDLPDQYREKFSDSFPIRKEQHLEIGAYVDELLKEGIEEAVSSFKPDFFSLEDYKSSLYPFRKKIGKFFGYPPPKAKQGKIKKFEKAGEDKYTDIYRVWVEVIDGVTAYGIYMVPKNITGKAPLLIAQHGGGGNPEAICDLDTRINYHSFGPEAVKRGYIVWAPALAMKCGYGGDPDIPGANRDQLDKKLKLVGSSIIGVELHKIIEGTKTLIKERPEIDADRVGMTGLSWGGFYTMYVSALWAHIKVACPSANLRDTKAVMERALISESRMPADRMFLKGVGHFQAVGMICPRPCMLQLGETDGLFDMEGAKIEAERAASFYEKLGVGERFKFATHPGGHVFYNPDIFDFFEKWLK